jgi:hypothetical protein
MPIQKKSSMGILRISKENSKGFMNFSISTIIMMGSII